MEARPEIVAIQVGHVENEMCKGMGAIHHHIDVPGMRGLGDLLNRQDLACPVDHLRYIHQFRAGGKQVSIGPDD